MRLTSRYADGDHDEEPTMATERTSKPDHVPGAPMSREAALEGMEEILLENWLVGFDAKLAAFDVRQAAFFRKLGIHVAGEDEAPESALGTELALGR